MENESRGQGTERALQAGGIVPFEPADDGALGFGERPHPSGVGLLAGGRELGQHAAAVRGIGAALLISYFGSGPLSLDARRQPMA